MRKSRKVLLFIVGLIALIAIGLFSYLQIRISEARKGLIHQRSHALIRVNVDAIAKDIGWNALLNPNYYILSDSKDTTSLDEEIELGLDIPAEIYFFKMDSSEIYYTHQKIGDFSNFKLSLSKYIKNDSVQLEINQYYSSKDNRFAVIFNENEVLISMSMTKDSTNWNKLNSLWQDRSKLLVEVKDFEGIDLLWAEKGDIVYSNLLEQTKGTIDFDNGKIEFSGFLSNSDIHLNKDPKARILDTSNILNFYSNGDFRGVFKRYEKVLGNYNIPIDTLNRYFGGYMDLQWKAGEIIQQDTIVTYDYDDNFEMTEKREIRSIEVPHLTLFTKASPHLASYLPEKIFYKFNKQVVDDFIELTTSNEKTMDINQLSKVSSSLMLSFRPDSSTRELLIFFPLIKKINSILMEANPKDANQILFQGNIRLEDPKIHALYYLLN